MKTPPLCKDCGHTEEQHGPRRCAEMPKDDNGAVINALVFCECKQFVAKK